MNNEDLKKIIAEFADFPATGVSFKDISPLLSNPDYFKFAIEQMCKVVESINFNKILAIESRGFIFSSAIAYQLGKGLVMCRKPGKLPGKLASQKYKSEYASSELTVQNGVLKNTDKVLIIDDVLATGYTVRAAYDLVRSFSQISGCLFLIELNYLKGREKLLKTTELVNEQISSIINYEG